MLRVLFALALLAPKLCFCDRLLVTVNIRDYLQNPAELVYGGVQLFESQSGIRFRSIKYRYVEFDRFEGDWDKRREVMVTALELSKRRVTNLFVTGPIFYGDTPFHAGLTSSRCGQRTGGAAVAWVRDVAYRVDDDHISAGMLVIAHELGHLYGADHDWVSGAREPLRDGGSVPAIMNDVSISHFRESGLSVDSISFSERSLSQLNKCRLAIRKCKNRNRFGSYKECIRRKIR